MKANELMIGDWVQHPVYMGNLVPCRVVGISTEITVEFDTGARKYEALNFAQPIPLTAEILVKNGFADFRKHDEDGMHHFEYCINGMRIDQLADTLFVWICPATDNSILTIKYVHELQHALKLCGIDKNIGL